MSMIAIEGYASVFHVLDDQKDCIHPGAFQHSLSCVSSFTTPKMLWQHDALRPIGRWTHLQEDQRGLYVKGLLFLDLPQGQEAWTLVQHKVLDGLSIGFQVEQATRCPKTGVRVLHRVRLLEISLVTFAAARPWTSITYCVPSLRDPTSSPPRVSQKNPQDIVQKLQALSHTLAQGSRPWV